MDLSQLDLDTSLSLRGHAHIATVNPDELEWEWSRSLGQQVHTPRPLITLIIWSVCAKTVFEFCINKDTFQNLKLNLPPNFGLNF